MKEFASTYGKSAMVIGAAEGLGAAFARNLSALGFDLVLADIKPMESLGNGLAQEFGNSITCIATDLNKKDASELLFDAWQENGCRLLVYNAAYGPVRPFLANSPDQMEQYINVNVRTTVNLVHRILGSAKNERTGILLLSSLAGFRGTSYVIPYAATKSYLWNLIEGLHYEFRNMPYDFSICCPGATATPNYLSTAPKKTLFTPAPADPDTVVRETLRKFGKSVFIIPGFSNRMVHFIFTRLLPRRWASALHNNTMKKMYDS